MIQDRVECKHCGNRIYPDWRHHGSNMKPCYGGLDSEAEPRDSSSISIEQTFIPLAEIAYIYFMRHFMGQTVDRDNLSGSVHVHVLAKELEAAWAAAKGQSNGR